MEAYFSGKPYDSMYSPEVKKLKIQKDNNDIIIHSLKQERKDIVERAKRYQSFRNIYEDNITIDLLYNKLSTKIFDEFQWKNIKTEDDVKWKEYFHGLYDLVVVYEDCVDPVTLLLVYQMIPTWYKILEPPECPVNSPIVREILEIFGELEYEQTQMSQKKLTGLSTRLNESVKSITSLHCQSFKIQKEIQELRAKNEKIKKVLAWSVGEYTKMASTGVSDISPPGTPDFSD